MLVTALVAAQIGAMVYTCLARLIRDLACRYLYTMLHSHHLTAKAFFDEPENFRVIPGHLDQRFLERLEKQRSFMSRLRLQYPELIQRRWFAEAHGGMSIGGNLEPDGERWDAAWSLENARDPGADHEIDFQYCCLPGMTPRTPPRGSATSPVRRGIKCTWQ